MKRAKYCLFYVTSAIHGSHFRVASELHEALIIKAETTPGLLSYELDGPTYRYLDKGAEKTTSILMTATVAGGVVQHWDISNGAEGSKPSLARQVKEAHAQASGVERVLVCKDELHTKRLEWANRKLAHAYLFQGRRFDTSKHEEAALMALHGHPTNLGDLTVRLGLTVSQGRLVFLRCWLKGRARWDINHEPLDSNLAIGG